jgi:hypothetical protein
MMIIGSDYHPSFQTIAFLIEETGECGERRLEHSNGEAERFYRELQRLQSHSRVIWLTQGVPCRPIRDWICADFNLAHWEAIKIVRKLYRP